MGGRASIIFWLFCMGLAVWVVSAESRPGSPDFDGYEQMLKNLTRNKNAGKSVVKSAYYYAYVLCMQVKLYRISQTKHKSQQYI